MADLPPWLDIRPSQFVQAANAGAQAGIEAQALQQRGRIAQAQINDDQARLALAAQAQRDRMEQARAELEQSRIESQARQELAKESLARQAQQTANQNAYQQARIMMGMQRLQDAETEQTQKLRESAMGFISGQRFVNDINSGMTMAQALARNPMAPKHFVDMFSEPSDVKIVDEIQRTEAAASAAGAAGRTEEMNRLRERSVMLRESMKGQQTVVSWDDQGRPVVQMGKGLQPTMATQSQAQQKLLKYENVMELINHLDKNLQAGHLGFQGIAGEYLLDRGLAQLVPELANQQRIDARSALIAMREGLMREISNDTRFSNADREEIARALPSSGIFESLPDAKQRIDTVRNIMVQRGKVYGQALGMPNPPLWTLSEDELKELYRVKGGNDPKLRDAIMSTLRRFH